MSNTPVPINAEDTDNLEDVEKAFSIKALTKYDDEIFEQLINDFPEFAIPANVAKINEDDMKSGLGKERWRAFMKKFETLIDDYNFGTLLRDDSATEYTEHGTIFAVRMQFYAIEIARNKYGLNDWVCKKK
ncbi:hypothetical protein CANARDRAFT_28710 [[Candida] arabinofermentans NRRL YB-2248]|uniref:Polysaccharide biosynthesis domain-containing protein n=1 Tax=[Candida] arabinofermentans NRRL YB-2248 TaxID=983967 RepID=A0A1E4SZR2_9ASCO|nr:hypothetical protein CANARDRAFT_28710 [[Candida] arabinofermentans NRRL YB-2248]